MKIPAIALVLVCFILPATESMAEATSQLEPKFPVSERGREGWVVLDSTVNDEGIVTDLNIKDSSGSSAFNEAALEAVNQWRLEPADGQQINVLINFVYERSEVHLSRKFIAHIADVHELVDAGELGGAKALIDEYRNNEELGAYELAYSLIAEGRVASVSGDKTEHLRIFRRAIINDGHWLERDKYLMLLHAIVVLEVQQKDFVSALQSYELLTETQPGRKLARNLEEPMQSVKALIEGGGDFVTPYKVADLEMTIEHAGRIRTQDIGFRGDYFGETAGEDEIELRE